MSKIKQLGKETLYYGMGHILSKVLNYFVSASYLTFIFNSEEGQYGIYGLMYSFAAMLMVLFTYGMETGFFRFASKQKDHAKAFGTAASSLLITTPIFALILIFFSRDLAGFLTQADDYLYVVFFIIIISLDALSAIPFANLRIENRPLRFMGIKIINVLINIVFLVFFLNIAPFFQKHSTGEIWSWYNESYRLHYVFIANLIASLITFGILLSVYFKFKLRIDKALYKKMILYALPLVLVGIMGTFNQLADRYLIKEWVSGSTDYKELQLGLYHGASRLAVLVILFNQAFKFAAEPFFFKHAENKGNPKIYADVAKYFTIGGSIFFLGTVLYMDILQYIIGSNFRKGLYIVPVLMPAYLMMGIYYNFATWYKIKDKTNIGAIIATIGAIITISMNYFLLPQAGIIGAAWSALVCFTTMSILAYVIGKKYYPIPYPIFKMGAYILLAVGLFQVSEWLRPFLDGNLLLILGINTILFFIYLGVAFYVDGKNLLKKV